MAKKFTKKTTFFYAIPPEKGAVIVTNHTGISAPKMFLLQGFRTWSHSAFLNKKTTKSHLLNNIVPRRKHKHLLNLLVIISLPVIVWFYKKINPIPVWRGSLRIMETMIAACDTKNNGIPQVIFPERLDENPIKVNPYLYELNRGFVHVMKIYHQTTGKIMHIYPAYSCPSLNKVIVGEPIGYNPDIPMREQKETVCKYLEEKIYALAKSLPPHKIILPFSDAPEKQPQHTTPENRD